MHPMFTRSDRLVNFSDHDAIVMEHAITIAIESFRESAINFDTMGEANDYFVQLAEEYREKADIAARMLGQLHDSWNRYPVA